MNYQRVNNNFNSNSNKITNYKMIIMKINCYNYSK